MLSNFDEYQSRQTAKFTRDTMRRNAENGFWNGAIPPFGYTTEIAEMRGPKAKKRLVIEPSEALMVQQIFRIKRVGVGQGPVGLQEDRLPSERHRCDAAWAQVARLKRSRHPDPIDLSRQAPLRDRRHPQQREAARGGVAGG